MRKRPSLCVLATLAAIFHSSDAFHQVHMRKVQRSFSSSNSEETDNQVETDSSTLQNNASVPSQPRPVAAQRRNLDPLVASLTRMDDETRNAARMQVPIWGELILDRSLMVLLPVAAFAVLGFGTSIFVAINAKDAIVDTLMDTTNQVMFQGVPPPNVDPNTCRGLCSSQQEDLESLGNFMKAISGAKQ